MFDSAIDFVWILLHNFGARDVECLVRIQRAKVKDTGKKEREKDETFWFLLRKIVVKVNRAFNDCHLNCK